jgi:hypothetical protein
MIEMGKNGKLALHFEKLNGVVRTDGDAYDSLSMIDDATQSFHFRRAAAARAAQRLDSHRRSVSLGISRRASRRDPVISRAHHSPRSLIHCKHDLHTVHGALGALSLQRRARTDSPRALRNDHTTI